MPTDAPFKPARKKPSIFWWLGGFFLLVVAIFVFQLFGPNPPIVVSRQTTYITGPLGSDGLPNYKQYVLELYRKGVTPENNAASLLWPAFWPGELDPPQYAAIAAELGLKQIPSKKEAVASLYDPPTRAPIVAWLRKQNSVPAKAGAAADPTAKDLANDQAALEEDSTRDNPLNEVVDNLLDRAMNHPWKSEQIPPLSRWVAENQKPLDRMVEASGRPRCYFPSPSLLKRDQEPLVETLLPGIQSARNVGRSLTVRAMHHLGEGRREAAWKDLFATHRIGRLAAQGKTMVEQLVGMAIDGMAHRGTLALLDQSSLSVEQARQVQRDLESLEHFNEMVDSLDTMERVSYLDGVIQFMARKNDSMLSETREMNGRQGVSYLNYVRVNWNVVLRKGNEWYDRLVAAARITNHKEREQAISQIEADLSRLSADADRPSTIVASAINPARRNDAVAAMMVGLFLPAFQAATAAEDRANTMLQLERLAAALAVYRAEHGTYPDKLEKLLPGVLKKLPVDLYNGKPFVYKRTVDGYTLYTAGENGNDDGGSNENEQVFEGQSATDLDQDAAEALRQKIPHGTDDWSIRLPRSAFSMPKVHPQLTSGDSP